MQEIFEHFYLFITEICLDIPHLLHLLKHKYNTRPRFHGVL